MIRYHSGGEEGINQGKKTNASLDSAGPPLMTSEMAMEGSPLAKCGLSRPPDTAMPNP